MRGLVPPRVQRREKTGDGLRRPQRGQKASDGHRVHLSKETLGLKVAQGHDSSGGGHPEGCCVKKG